MYLSRMIEGNEKAFEFQDVVNTRGNLDYVKNEIIYRNNPSQCVMVNSEGDLSRLSSYSPGTIAYTAGFVSMWQKSLDGTWVEV